MNKVNTGDRSTERNRFGYYGEEPEEGGVRAVRANSTGVRSTGSALPASSGTPGPEERRLDISELLRNVGMRYTHTFHLPAGREEDFEAVAPIEGEVTLTNTGGLLLLRGRARTMLRLECGRCLAYTDQPVEAELAEEFDMVTSHNAFRQEEVQAVDENLGGSVIGGGGNILELAELLRQNLLLAAPLQPRCTEECAGAVPGIIHTEGEPDEPRSEGTDNPLKHLAELLEAKRRAEAEESALPTL